MKKYIAVICALILALSLAGCSEQVVLGESKTYSVDADVQSLDIRINAADFSIKQAEAFSVESNLKNLSVSSNNGVLSIVDETKSGIGITYVGPELTLYIPADAVLDNISIKTGAAKMTAQALSAKSLKLQLGAGDMQIDSLNVAHMADIEGGAGKITIAGGTLNNLELEMGMGELNLTAALQGDSDLTLGVGESNIILIGSKEDYHIDLEKGLGSIMVDGQETTEFEGNGNGQNRVQIEGGVGSINLKFQ